MESQFILGDCFDILPTFPDQFFDICFTDPPYGIKRSEKIGGGIKHGNSLAKRRSYTEKDWDNKKIDNKIFDYIFKLSKNQIIWGGNYYCSTLGDTRCFIVWDKNNGSNDFADCELAWTNYKTSTRLIKWTWNGFIQQKKEDRYHPTQKPVGLYKKIINKFIEKNAIILDPFAGSGTLAIAALETGRRYVCIEKEVEYYDIAMRRIEEWHKTPRQQELDFGIDK